MRRAHFTPRLFQFLRELETHNDRTWFEANRGRYEAEVREPMLRFIADLGKPLRAISVQLEVDPRPVGGSMFRIHRDIRFSKDKSPYKTHVGAHFPHAGAGPEESAPGFYIHLEPAHSIGGGGLWHPDSEALKRVRDRIVVRTREWKTIRAEVSVQGESLKRVPAGYNSDHPCAEDLRLKDFYVMERFSERQICASSFLETYVDACRTAAPLMKFLTQAVGLSW